MFEFGSGELLVIALVALIVLGPERLPKAARFVGLWVRRARAQWNSVRDELERELSAEELRRSLRESQEHLRRAEESMRDHGRTAQRDFESLRDAVEDRPAPPPAHPQEPVVVASPGSPPAVPAPPRQATDDGKP